MEKYFANYNQSLALKELGFDMPCFRYIHTGDTGNNVDRYEETEPSRAINFNHDSLCISQPLKSQVFEWVRKEYRIISVIDFYCDNDEWEDTMYEVRISEFKHFKTHDSFVQSEYKSYEEAELACIDKLIEIIKTK